MIRLVKNKKYLYGEEKNVQWKRKESITEKARYKEKKEVEKELENKKVKQKKEKKVIYKELSSS